MNEHIYLAADLGGTSLRIALVNHLGLILEQKNYLSGYRTQTGYRTLIIDSIQDFQSSYPDSGTAIAIGIGLIGRVDHKGGTWLQIDAERSESLPLAADISQAFGLPCYIDNDVKSATKAEMKWGIGKVSQNFIYLNIGTGIAAGFVTAGHLIRGSHHNSGEVGHTKASICPGLHCGCGRMDCVELIAAGVGLDKCARLFQNDFPTKLFFPNDQRIDAREIFRLYKEGDPLCNLLVVNAASAIADLIMNLVRVTDPDTVVVGGGIVGKDLLYPMVLDKLSGHTMRFVKNGVVLTELQPALVGILGAAALAIDEQVFY